MSTVGSVVNDAASTVVGVYTDPQQPNVSAAAAPAEPDLSEIVYSEDSINVEAAQATITGVDMSPDGTRVLTCGNGNDEFGFYDLSVPFKPSSAVLDVEIPCNVANTKPKGPTWGKGGLKIFDADSSADGIHEYTALSPYAGTGLVYVGKHVVEANPTDVIFNAAGTQMFVINNFSFVWKYVLSGAWDPSTKDAGTLVLTFSALGNGTAARHRFSADDMHYYVYDDTNDIFVYECVSANDLTDLTEIGTFAFGSEVTLVNGFALNLEETKMIVAGRAPTSGDSTLYGYDL